MTEAHALDAETGVLGASGPYWTAREVGVSLN